MAGKHQIKAKPWKHRGFLVLLVLILLTTGGIGVAAAKYIQNSTGKMLLKAPEFYFTSEYLTADNSKFELNTDTTQLEFYLRNSADNLRYSEVDISYTLSLEKSVPEASGQLSQTGGTLPAGSVKSQKIILSDMAPGVTYTVTATGEAGYSQTISATFKVGENDENLYKNLSESSDGYLLLTVWSHNISGDLSVTFPTHLIPDNTNPGMESVFNKDTNKDAAFTVVDFGKYSSQTYRFFGSATVDQFNVEIGNHRAAPSILP